jgi:hypothetical protein
MKSTIAALLVSAALASGSCLAAGQAGATAASSDAQRLDALIQRNQQLIEENARLRSQSKETAFAECMQAAQGQTNPMVAESIGGHCDQLLKR